MLHKYVLFKHVYVAGIRWNYTLHKYVLFRHLYVPDIRCNHTFYFNVYTLRIYVATIRCNYTLYFDMYTLQLYAAIIRYVSTCIRCNYTLQLYVVFGHVYVADIRCNYTFSVIRIYVHIHTYTLFFRSRIRANAVQYTLLNTEVLCTYMLSLQSTYTCFNCANTLQEYVGFRHVYVATIRYNYTLNIRDNKVIIRGDVSYTCFFVTYTCEILHVYAQK